MPNSLLKQWKSNALIFKKSTAQGETLVRPRVVRPKSGGLKPKRIRPYRLMGRFSAEERAIVVRKAKQAEMSVNKYIRSATLGFDYKPPLSDGTRKVLFALNHELTAQGRNLNQIARHLNSGGSKGQGLNMLNAIRTQLVGALIQIKAALSQGQPCP